MSRWFYPTQAETKIGACCFVEGRNVFTKQSWWLAGVDLQLSRSHQPCKSLTQKKTLYSLPRDSKWPWKDCGNGSYEVKIRSFPLFALETLCMMILNMHGTTVPPHYQKQHINSELITCKGKNTASARFSTSSDFPAHKNLKLTGGKLSKANQPTGTICWSKSKLNFWASHISGSSLSNSSKTAWLHAAFLPLKVNVPIS